MVIENILFSMRVKDGGGCFWSLLCVGPVFGCGRVYGVWFVGVGDGRMVGFGGGWIFGVVAGCWCVCCMVGVGNHPYGGPCGGQGIVNCGGMQA